MTTIKNALLHYPHQGGGNSLFNESEVRKTFSTFVELGGFTEVRVLEAIQNGQNKNYKKTYAGFFDNADALVFELSKFSFFMGAYFIFNKLNVGLLSRSYNHFKAGESGTGDKDIERRIWLLIDIDPVRPSRTSASDEKKLAAKNVANAVCNYLTSIGWADPICADSGNGFHLLYPIDLPTDDGELVKSCLEALASQFDTPKVKIDLAVHNAARIMRLYGTRACKGDEVAHLNTYHRISKIVGGAA